LEVEVPDHRHYGLLRAHRERPCCHRATDNGDEFPSPHGVLEPRTKPYHMLNEKIVRYFAAQEECRFVLNSQMRVRRI
jgi:hypothetical protein